MFNPIFCLVYSVAVTRINVFASYFTNDPKVCLVLLYNVNLYNCVLIIIITLGQLIMDSTEIFIALLTGCGISAHTVVTVGPLLVCSTFVRVSYMQQ